MNRTPITVSPVLPPLESVLCTEELNRRPSRPPDYERGNRALVSLAQALADSPRTILQTLADTILEVFQCGSAGDQPRDGRWNEVPLAGHRRRVEAAHRRRHAARLRPVRRRARSQLSPVVQALRAALYLFPAGDASGRRVPAGSVLRRGQSGRHDLGDHAR